MKLVKRISGRKIATSYLTVLVVLMFSMIFVGNGLGFVLTDPGSDTTEKTPDTGLSDTSSSETQTNSDTNDSKIYSNLEKFTPNEREVPIEEIESKVEKVFGNVSNGETKEVLTESLEEDTCIEEVQLTLATNLNNVKVTVIRLKDKPENISLRLKKNESVYCHIDIKLMANDEYVT
jgi:hypothetical protein